MMTQEEYLDGVLALKRQGKTIAEIEIVTDPAGRDHGRPRSHDH